MGWFLAERGAEGSHIDSLDGLRGFAVLLVLWSHLSLFGLHPIPGVDLVGAGKYGVFLFFSLSSFLLTLPLLERTPAQLREPRLWLRYALRRVLRIYPLYTVVLVFSWFTTSVLGRKIAIPLSGEDLWRHWLLLDGKKILWAIPVEFKYYLLIPVFAVVAGVVLRGRGVWIAAVCMAAVAASSWLWPAEASVLEGVDLGPYLPTFLLGGLAADLHRRLREKPLSRPIRIGFELVAVLSLAGSLLLIPAIASWVSGELVERDRFQRSYVLFGTLWSALLVAHLHGLGWIARGLSLAPLRFIGVISFGLYLWHLSVTVDRKSVV